MQIRITCPSCRACFAIDQSLRGKRIACQECLKPLLIPAAKAAAPRKADSDSLLESKTRPAPARQPAPVAARQTAPRRASDDQEWTPRRRTAKKRGGIPVLWLIGGAVAVCGFFFIVVAGIVAFVLFRPGGLLAAKEKPAVHAQDKPQQAPAPQPKLEAKPAQKPAAKTNVNPPPKNASQKALPKPAPTAKAKQPPGDKVAKKSVPPGWKQFTHPQGGFTVTMPAGAKPSTDGKPGQVSLVGFKLEDAVTQRFFLVAFQRLPPAEARLPPELLLEGANERFAEGSGIPIASERNIELNGYPGIEFTQELTAPNGITMRMFTRIYIVNGQMYVVSAGAVDLQPEAPDFTTFFDSFQLTKK